MRTARIFCLLRSLRHSRQAYMFFTVVLTLLSLPMDGGCLSEKYPSDIPKGFSAQKTKYRVIEWDNPHRIFVISDANKISIKSETVMIYPPVFVQECAPYLEGWRRYTLKERYETMYVMDNMSIIRTDGNRIAVPKEAKKVKEDTSPFGIFRSTMLAADKLLSAHMFIDIFSSKEPGSQGILKVMTTDHFKAMSRVDKIRVMQSSWKMWASICGSSCGSKLILGFVDRNNNFLGGANGEEASSIVLP